MMDDDYFDSLEESINKPQTDVEPIAFKEWKERGHAGFHSKKNKYSDCRHPQKTVHDDSRMVRCDDCAAYLDPYDCLVKMVSATERNQNIRETLGKDLEELREKIYVAKKDLKSLDGKIKRRKKNV